MQKYLDFPSCVVGVTTLALFIGALFVKGVTHDLFLEAGVFLVSIKVIVMMFENRQIAGRIEKKLDHMQQQLDRIEATGRG